MIKQGAVLRGSGFYAVVYPTKPWQHPGYPLGWRGVVQLRNGLRYETERYRRKKSKALRDLFGLIESLPDPLPSNPMSPCR